MHTKQMSESDGKFDNEKSYIGICPSCEKEAKIIYKVWESSCGGYEDTKYRCSKCNYSWWVDGIDS